MVIAESATLARAGPEPLVIAQPEPLVIAELDPLVTVDSTTLSPYLLENRDSGTGTIGHSRTQTIDHSEYDAIVTIFTGI